MIKAIRILGPAFDAHCPLDPAGAEVIIGRDPSCHVVLPDPKRNVSRRHLALWLQDEQVCFKVISTVAGVRTTEGKFGPGEQGTLPLGQFMKLSDYTLNAETQAAPLGRAGPQVKAADPWAEIDSQWTGQGAHTRMDPSASVLEPDPFSDWGFDPAPGLASSSRAAPPPKATEPNADAAMRTFLQSAGIDKSHLANWGPHEMKALGARVRVMMKGLIALQLDLDGTQSDMGFSHSESSNPLMGKMPANAKLAYLLGEHATPPGKLDPDQALADLLKRLQAHEAAMLAASRAVAVGVLTDFEPATLQALLDKEGSRMPFMGNVRLWDLYSKHYEKLGGNLRLWLQDTLSRHFAPMYSGEYEKKRK